MSLNLVPNPSFEHDVLGTSYIGGVTNDWVLASTGAAFKEATVKNDWAGSPAGQSLFLETPSDVAVRTLSAYPLPTIVPGQEYFLKVKIRLLAQQAGSKVSAMFWFNDTFVKEHQIAGSEHRSPVIAGATNSIFTLECRGRAPENAATVTIVPVYADPNGNAGVIQLWVDEISLSDTPDEYFDGDTPGCRWTGAVGFSKSENLADNALYQRVLPVFSQDSKVGFFGRYLCDGIMAMLQGLDKIVQDTPSHPGWSIILDPVTCPLAWLPWCAQLYGVSLPAGATEAEWRETIHETPAQKRGTVEALKKAVEKSLTGTKWVGYQEFVEGKAYKIGIQTISTETPSTAATEEAIRSQKAGGLQFVYTPAGITWAEAVKAYSAVAGTVTWENVKPGDV